MTEPQRIDPDDLADRMRAASERATRPSERPIHSVLSPGDDGPEVQAEYERQRDLEWQRITPKRFHAARLADLEPAVRGELDAWVSVGGPENLVLLGAVGVGKTHGALAAAHDRFMRGHQVLFAPIGELLDWLDWRRPDSAIHMADLCQVDLLIVDDLGTERSNEWTGERLYLVVNRRWLDGRPTIVTSNLNPDQLGEALGERTWSRLADGATAVRFTGKDRRRG